MSTSATNDLFLIIKEKWFNEILSGIKKEEYRLPTIYWSNRLLDRNYRNIIFQLGYAKNAKRIIAKYLGYELKEITQGMFDDKIKVFAIHFDSTLTVKVNGKEYKHERQTTKK